MLYSTNQTPTTTVAPISNDAAFSSMNHGATTEPAYHNKEEFEVRREAVGSDRRDESVMGPPLAPYSLGPLHTNNQRDVPMGQDAPASTQMPTIPVAFAQTDTHVNAIVKESDDNRTEDTYSSVHQGPNNSFHNNSNHAKSTKYKNRSTEDKDLDLRTSQGKGKKNSKGGRRSSTPDFERDSVRHRHRSPHSSLTSSSNDRSSNESYSDER